jgi:hypothetical protein
MAESKRHPVSKVATLKRIAPSELDTPTDLAPEAVAVICAALNFILADSFAGYLETARGADKSGH